jgi:hypothetical protein
MIQLASDPNASRDWRPAAAGDATGKGAKGRPGHAWPFLSKQPVQRPLEKSEAKPSRNDGGS